MGYMQAHSKYVTKNRLVLLIKNTTNLNEILDK